MKSNRAIISLVTVNLIIVLFILAERGVAGGQNGAPMLRGGGLELVDSNGQTRARINMEPTGEVVFRLLDQTGTIRVKLGASKDGSGLVLLNDSTEVGLHLLAKGTGSSLKLIENGRERLITP